MADPPDESEGLGDMTAVFAQEYERARQEGKLWQFGAFGNFRGRAIDRQSLQPAPEEERPPADAAQQPAAAGWLSYIVCDVGRIFYIDDASQFFTSVLTSSDNLLMMKRWHTVTQAEPCGVTLGSILPFVSHVLMFHSGTVSIFGPM